MKKKTGIIVGSIALAVVAVVVICCMIFGKSNRQYNENGISTRLSITINTEQTLEYIGTSDEYDIYSMWLEDVAVIRTDAQEIDLKDALEAGVLTIDDMISVCEKENNNGLEIYTGENYKIIVEDKKCLIAPLDYEEMNIMGTENY